MSTQPLISIVIPVFNQRDYIARAIDSVISQETRFDIELIVINDGSTDNVEEVLSGYGNKFELKTISNSGQSAALNYGWSVCRGEFLGYLSADDILLPNAIQRLSDALLSHPSAVVAYGDFETIDSSDRVIRYVKTAAFVFEAMLTKLECPPGPGALFRRSDYVSAGGWNVKLRRMPDYDFWLRMGLKGSFVRVPEALARWRVHEGSQAFSSIPIERANEPIAILENFFGRTDLPIGLLSLQKKSFASALLVSAQLHARSKRYWIAFNYFLKSIKSQPMFLVAPRTWHIVSNAIFQQAAHRLLAKFRFW